MSLTFAFLLNNVSQIYQAVTPFAEMIRHLNPMLNIVFKFNKEWPNSNIEFPEDWQQQLKKINGFENATAEKVPWGAIITSELRSLITYQCLLTFLFDLIKIYDKCMQSLSINMSV
ncbi:hypothetical protein M3Y97_01069600 [Aphelenchoides bicaudatus]|nr:hypothetical protein M3Y97_01069600 [Aphelenchoides bicaudatus]